MEGQDDIGETDGTCDKDVTEEAVDMVDYVADDYQDRNGHGKHRNLVKIVAAGEEFEVNQL